MSNLVKIILGIVASVIMLLSAPFETVRSGMQAQNSCESAESPGQPEMIINERTDTIKIH